MTGRRQADIDLAETHGFAIGQRLLRGIRHILEAGAHDGERFGCGEGRAMARPGVIAVPMCDECARHRHGGIDIKVARFAVEAARRRIEPGARVQGVGH